MKKLVIVVALCGSFVWSPVHAKTFVGVLWPMFGPLPAIGLVELVGELKMMPGVEVSTYLHQSWPALVADINRQPPGTRTVVIGYSLGANSSVFVANKAKYVDLIIALQPSMLSWNPAVRGKVGRMIEIYNPNPWMTFGGMGSKKLIGENIEYIANNDSHPGAQFDPQFRSLVKREIAKLTAEGRVETAQAERLKPVKLAHSSPSLQPRAVAEERPKPPQRDLAAAAFQQSAQAGRPRPLQVAHPSQPLRPDAVAEERPKPPQRDLPAVAPERAAQVEMSMSAKPVTLEQDAKHPLKDRPHDWSAFLNTLSDSVDSGDLSIKRELTLADMMAYVKKTYTVSQLTGTFSGKRSSAVAADANAGGTNAQFHETDVNAQIN